MAPTKMKVVELKYSVLRNYFNGCVQHIQEKGKQGTWPEGQNLGIDDALKVVEEKDLTFVMKMALKGLRHKSNESSNMGDFYTKSDAHNYFCGYKSGMNDALEIITGETFDK